MSTGGNMDDDSKVALARMEGKLDRITDAQLRHGSDIVDVRSRLNGHSDRLRELENANNVQKGAFGAVKVAWALGAASVTAVGAFVARHLGV